MSYNLWEVKVDGKDEVTTPAGTFECLKVSFVNRINADGKQYLFADGMGTCSLPALVRYLIYDFHALMNQELVKLDKPQA